MDLFLRKLRVEQEEPVVDVGRAVLLGPYFILLLFRDSFGEIRNRVMGYAQELAPGVEAFKGVFL